jgi:hypothetical protein
MIKKTPQSSIYLRKIAQSVCKRLQTPEPKRNFSLNPLEEDEQGRFSHHLLLKKTKF